MPDTTGFHAFRHITILRHKSGLLAMTPFPMLIHISFVVNSLPKSGESNIEYESDGWRLSETATMSRSVCETTRLTLPLKMQFST